MQIVSKDIEKYCHEFSIQDSPLLSNLCKETWEKEDLPQMITGSLVGGILQLLIKISKARNILEVGTFTGYSALKMAEALPSNGSIDCCELNKKHIQTSQKWFNKAGLGSKITIHEGPAETTMKKFKSGTFDLIFIDADKENYPIYYTIGLGLLKSGGLCVFDNMLWNGNVINPEDDEAKAIRETAEQIKNNHRLEPILLPVRDGVMIYRKIK